MSEKDGKQTITLRCPSINDTEAWKAYWKTQGQPWRKEPEIYSNRQEKLDHRRKNIVPDVKQGKYPFKGMKLSRADVEWLLATHQEGRGPVWWNEEKNKPKDKRRSGIDLRGADLRAVDLSGLPLTGMRGGLDWDEWSGINPEQRHKADVHFEEANLSNALLEDARLRGAYLEGAILFETSLHEATLYRAHFGGAYLRKAKLEKANLRFADLRGVYLRNASLAGADLRNTIFNAETDLERVILGDENFGYVSFADVHWGDVNLSLVDWTRLKVLGDEYEAGQKKDFDKKVKVKEIWLREYQSAVRANRQLGVVLRDQGLNELADRFPYRAQVLQRKVFWKQKKIGQYLFSLLLSLLAGYGYKPWRAFLAYLLVITAFATTYFALGRTVGPVLSPLGSFVFSMTSFHGRGFFPGGIALDDPLTVLAALEAFVGLLIEVTFIATLTQRLFSR
jgi:uncharacterized protein YjbI with pentapeptide repeats